MIFDQQLYTFLGLTKISTGQLGNQQRTSVVKIMMIIIFVITFIYLKLVIKITKKIFTSIEISRQITAKYCFNVFFYYVLSIIHP